MRRLALIARTFLNGISPAPPKDISFNYLGTLPLNGTKCVTNNTGINNIFVKNYIAPEPVQPELVEKGPNLKLAWG